MQPADGQHELSTATRWEARHTCVITRQRCAGGAAALVRCMRPSHQVGLPPAAAGLWAPPSAPLLAGCCLALELKPSAGAALDGSAAESAVKQVPRLQARPRVCALASLRHQHAAVRQPQWRSTHSRHPLPHATMLEAWLPAPSGLPLLRLPGRGSAHLKSSELMAWSYSATRPPIWHRQLPAGGAVVRPHARPPAGAAGEHNRQHNCCICAATQQCGAVLHGVLPGSTTCSTAPQTANKLLRAAPPTLRMLPLSSGWLGRLTLPLLITLPSCV